MSHSSARICSAALALSFLMVFSTTARAADSFDSDLDGLDDNNDNCTLVPNPDQLDSNGDGFGNRCDGDLNNDRNTDFQDVAAMKSVFYSTTDPDADLDGSGAVNFVDLGMQKGMLFNKPGPTGAHPQIPECNCYFSGDCLHPAAFCDYGNEGFTVELSCWWRTPKPTAAGNGCSTEYEGSWGAICDGQCALFSTGSATGGEDPTLIGTAIGLWAEAMLAPSLRGGGPVDSTLSEAALALPFRSGPSAEIIGRHTADLLSISGGDGFHEYFCHYEHHPEDPGQFVDISGDNCRITAARATVDALQAELRERGSGAAVLAVIPAACPGYQSMFTPRCAQGPQALSCFTTVVERLAAFLSTPRATAAAANEVERLLLPH